MAGQTGQQRTGSTESSDDEPEAIEHLGCVGVLFCKVGSSLVYWLTESGHSPEWELEQDELGESGGDDDQRNAPRSRRPAVVENPTD